MSSQFGFGRLAGAVALCLMLVICASAAKAQSIEYIGGIDLAGSDARTVQLKGNIAYVMDFEEGIHLVDVSSSTTPTTVTLFTVDDSLENPGYGDFEISGDRGYFVRRGEDHASIDGINYINRIYTLDLSSPASPAVLDWAPLGSSFGSNSLAVDGENLCMLGYSSSTSFEDSGLLYFEYFNPSSPVQTGYWKHRGHKIDIAGEMIVATDSTGGGPRAGFRVFRKPQFNAMKLLGHSGSTMGIAWDIKLQGNRVYLGLRDSGEWENGVEVYDLSNPVIPRLLGAAYYPETTLAIAEQDGIVYVATQSGFVKVIDATNPADVQLVADVALANFPVMTDIEVQGDKVYVALRDSGLAILQVSGVASNRAEEWKTYQ